MERGARCAGVMAFVCWQTTQALPMILARWASEAAPDRRVLFVKPFTGAPSVLARVPNAAARGARAGPCAAPGRGVRAPSCAAAPRAAPAGAGASCRGRVGFAVADGREPVADAPDRLHPVG